MLGAALLLGLGAIVLVSVFWNEIKDWLIRAVTKVKSIVSGVVYGCKVFIQKLRDGAKEISRHYSKQGTQWKETTVQRDISENDVPEEIRKKVGYSSFNEVDITSECEQQLELA